MLLATSTVYVYLVLLKMTTLIEHTHNKVDFERKHRPTYGGWGGGTGVCSLHAPGCSGGGDE